ncbi:MAG: hypothetical protein M0Q90_04030 [Bacteroidales bacterium]|jgi:hypothetical protein|nr:hypothetical protein [Bacteroidales bacterium]
MQYIARNRKLQIAFLVCNCVCSKSYKIIPRSGCSAEWLRAGLKPNTQGDAQTTGLKAGVNQEASTDF